MLNESNVNSVAVVVCRHLIFIYCHHIAADAHYLMLVELHSVELQSSCSLLILVLGPFKHVACNRLVL